MKTRALIIGFSLMPLTLIAGIETSESPQRNGISAAWKEAKAYEVSCWQEGQRVVNESGKGQLSMGEELIKTSITIHPTDGKNESISIVGMQKSLCILRGR